MDADVIVIGAGAAGLIAARDLARRSLRVVLLEARDRVGGRVWTRRMPGVGVPVELGAEFIHGPAKETAALLRAAGSAAIPVGGHVWIHAENGELRHDLSDFATFAGIFEATRNLAEDESVERFLKRFDADPHTREKAAAARYFVEGFDAADPAIASVQAIAEEWRSGVDWAIARPPDGYGPLFEGLRAACVAAGVRIFLSTIVRAIAWSDGGVTVRTDDGRSTRRTITARAAVVTLPVGVLRHEGEDYNIVFEPALPSDKHRALAYIESGRAVKVALWFKSAFWERIHNGRYRGDVFFRHAASQFPSYWVSAKNALVTAWAGGPKAIALSRLSEPNLLEAALNGFGGVFGEPALAHEELKGAAMHDWGHDPFARGAYSYVAVGGGNVRAELGAPVADALFFAGEATSIDGQGGTVNGAFETGARAAAQAAQALGAKAR